MHRIGIALALTVLVTAVGAPPAAAHHRDATLERFAAPVATGVVGPDDTASFNATLPSGRRVTPAGLSTMVGELPLGAALTPDGRYLVVSDDDQATVTGQRLSAYTSARGAATLTAGFRVTVVRTADMTIADDKAPPTNPAVHAGPVVPGVTQKDNLPAAWLGVAVKDNGAGQAPTVYVSGGPSDIVSVWRLSDAGILTLAGAISISVPSDPATANFGMAAPGGLALSPDGGTLYVVNNNANTIVAVDTATNQAGEPRAVGFFPYTAVIAPRAGKLFVSNWGLTERRFGDAYLAGGLGSPSIGGGASALFANPVTDPQRSSSVSALDLTGGATRAISLARPIDGVDTVGGTHPSAMAVGTWRGHELVYVADANEDRVAVIDAAGEQTLRAIALPSPMPHGDTFGLYPDALALSPDGRTLYVAEAGLNAVAVLDVSNPWHARDVGAIPTGWYPSALALSPDGGTLYVVNAKGFGAPLPANGSAPNVNMLFGTAQRIDLAGFDLAGGAAQVRDNTYRVLGSRGARGLHAAEEHVRHVIFVLRENKTYDSYLGADSVLNGRGADGYAPFAAWDALVPNTKSLAEQFAVGDRTYADSEESDAGHQYALAGTSTDYSQKTLASKQSRPLINVKNEDPEDYPLRGYLFNAAARAHVSYRDYGDMIRLSGYDEGANRNGCLDDPANRACPAGPVDPLDFTSPTTGLGGLYAETTPALKVLGGHVDLTYPGWSLRISDQRREREFERDYGALIADHRAPGLAFVWLPQDHTGNAGGQTIAPGVEVADNDAAVGRLVDFVSHSRIWRDTAILIAEDDAQANSDHVSAHRTVALVVSPWARRGAVLHTLVSTASLTKTVDELLGLQPSSMGDELATDMRDWFTARADSTPYDALPYVTPKTTAAGLEIAALGDELDMSGPDADSFRQARLDELALAADRLTEHRTTLPSAEYAQAQRRLYRQAVALVRDGAPADGDD